VGKFNKKKYKIKRVFARFVRGGKWHVVVDEGHSIFFPCRHYGWYGGLNEMSPERTGGVFRGPFNGFIFTSPRKICGTCMKMERNKEILKEAGFKTLKEAGFIT